MTIIEFLTPRLDEQAESARGVVDGYYSGSPAAAERELRDVEADRKLIAAYVTAREAVPPVDLWYEVADGIKVGVADGLESALKIRAARWNDHPDYKPEWAPDEPLGDRLS